MTAPVYWLTGLSGSGKTTIGSYVSDHIKQSGGKSVLLDGDEIRRNLAPLGFSEEDRSLQATRVAWIAGLLALNDVVPIVALISPTAKIRAKAISHLTNLGMEVALVYVDCPISVCQKRDPKGLYEKHARGEILAVTGLGGVWEPPEQPDIHLETSRRTLLSCGLEIISHWLDKT